MMFAGFVALNKEENPGQLKKVSFLGRGEQRKCFRTRKLPPAVGEAAESRGGLCLRGRGRRERRVHQSVRIKTRGDQPWKHPSRQPSPVTQKSSI